VRRASFSVDADPSMDRASTVYRKVPFSFHV